MPIPEAQLETWAKPGAFQSSKDTYASIKTVLEDAKAPYSRQSVTSYLQGSYGNDTNVFGVDSDVDLVLQCNSIYYYDLSDMPDAEQNSFKATHGTTPYSYDAFKQEVIGWLQGQYGADVECGGKAIRIKARNNRRNADVLPCVLYCRYLSYNAGPSYVEGICFFMPDGTQVVNYPKLHSTNMTKKHQATNGWLKPTVRIMKNMRNRLIADGKLEAGVAPSYYLEGLLYNVPADKFGKSHGDTFVNAMTWIIGADRSKLVCANEQYYLIREGSPVTWRNEKLEKLLNAVSKLWADW